MADRNEIVLYGTVGASFWDEEYFTPSMVRDLLAAVQGDVTVRINSGGGIAADGQAIYNLLRDHDGQVSVVVDGVAASAASLIAMAGDTITLRQGAILMIHDPASPWVDGRGTEADHLRAARSLALLSNAYARVYAQRAGISPAEAREIMKAETYYDGPMAVDAGFATATDDEQAQGYVAFDYATYAHAPQELLDAGAGLARRTSRRAVAALMAGLAAPKSTKGHSMAENTEDETMTETTAAQDDTMAGAEATEETTTIAVEGVPVVDPDDSAEDDDAPAPAVALLNLAHAAGLTVPQTRDLAARGLTLAQAAQAVATMKEKGNPMTGNIRPGGPSTTILRDERDTMRQGIEGAIVARMSRARDVSGPARDYVGMTLPEMAWASMGKTGRPGRGAGELRAVEMAFGAHTTSDLPAVLENALNKRLLAAYEAYNPVYRAIAERIDFTDFRPHPISQIGDWPKLLPVPESGEIQYGSISDKKESVALVAYARAFAITRQMLINDDLMSIERVLSTRGRAVAAFEDELFFTMMLSGASNDGPTLLETGRQVFNTTDGTKAGTATAVTPAGVSAGYAAMRKRKGVAKTAAEATFLSVSPAFLLTGPDKEFEAMQLLAPIQAAQASNVNPYVGKLTPLQAPHITGNAWYLLANPSDVPSFMYGYLSGEAGPRMRMDEPFGMQGINYSVELDFGVGATDYRGVYKNAGA